MFMICKHGFDIISCPICRISTNTRPSNDLGSNLVNANLLKPINPAFKQHFNNKSKIEGLRPNFTHTVPIPKVIGQIPNFENKILIEKLKDINIANFDKFGISEKIPLSEKELNLKDKD